MAGTALFILFALVYVGCWTINRFLLKRRKLNPGYVFLFFTLALLLNQLRLVIVHGSNAYVVGTIVGTWLIPVILGLFIARKFARDNPGSVPWGSELTPVTSSTTQESPTERKEPSWMKD